MLADRDLSEAEKDAFVRMYTQAWPQPDGFRRCVVRTMSETNKLLLEKIGVEFNQNVNIVDLALTTDSRIAVRTGRDGDVHLRDRASLN